MLTVAVPLEEALATLVAPMVTLAGVGMAEGAVYKPPAEIVPSAALPPASPFTLQFTAVFAELVTVALNCCIADGARVIAPGATLTVIGGAAGG